MFRFVQLWIDPSTEESAPATKKIQLTEGVIKRWWIGFPDGCADLVHVSIYEFEHQLIPRGEDEDLFWNNYIFEIPDSYHLTEEPYTLEVRAWNEDDTNRQYVVVGVALEPEEEVTLADLYESFKMFLSTLIAPTE